MTEGAVARAPARFERPGMGGFMLALVIASLRGVGFSPGRFVEGLPAMAAFAANLFPPSTERLAPILAALAETFMMAVAGTAIGATLSLPLAVLAVRRFSPHASVALAVRGLISLFRTVPDLVWALFFVVTVGLGPFAGTLALVVDTIGFFAEAMEEADRGPQEALAALGAGRSAIVVSAVLPAAVPTMIGTTLFSLEKATRSSVVLGLVGAGGIGMELEVAMSFFNYPEAATIILAIFALVLAVEQASQALRLRIIA